MRHVEPRAGRSAARMPTASRARAASRRRPARHMHDLRAVELVSHALIEVLGPVMELLAIRECRNDATEASSIAAAPVGSGAACASIATLSTTAVSESRASQPDASDALAGAALAEEEHADAAESVEPDAEADTPDAQLGATITRARIATKNMLATAEASAEAAAGDAAGGIASGATPAALADLAMAAFVHDAPPDVCMRMLNDVEHTASNATALARRAAHGLLGILSSGKPRNGGDGDEDGWASAHASALDEFCRLAEADQRRVLEAMDARTMLLLIAGRPSLGAAQLGKLSAEPPSEVPKSAKDADGDETDGEARGAHLFGEVFAACAARWLRSRAAAHRAYDDNVMNLGLFEDTEEWPPCLRGALPDEPDAASVRHVAESATWTVDLPHELANLVRGVHRCVVPPCTSGSLGGATPAQLPPFALSLVWAWSGNEAAGGVGTDGPASAQRASGQEAVDEAFDLEVDDDDAPAQQRLLELLVHRGDATALRALRGLNLAGCALPPPPLRTMARRCGGLEELWLGGQVIMLAK